MRCFPFILTSLLFLSGASAARLTSTQTATGHSLGSFGYLGSEMGEPAGGVVWSPDNMRVYTLDTTGRLFIWDARTGRLVAQRQQWDRSTDHLTDLRSPESGAGDDDIGRNPVIAADHSADATACGLDIGHRGAVAEFDPCGTGAIDDELSALCRQREAVTRGARLVVLPEYAVFTVPDMGARLVEAAEPVDGPTVTRLLEVAGELDVAVVVGVNETAGDGKIHNTLLGIRGGEVVARYRKVHLYDAFGYTESDQVVPGEPAEPELLEVDGFRVGMQTCYDLRFPESSRVLVDAGADVVAVPAQWVPGPLKEHHWNTLLRARAIENTVYLMAAGQSPRTGVGGSAVVDPAGVALAALGDVPGVGVAVLERARLEQVREVNPALARRRYRVHPA